ncbi:MAG TPA: hypothetical protein PKV96_00025 [Candidatus Saccharimonas sp.]|jgi:NhaP-type Na+/H+ or K+/H+ antiporter|nr:hypothetical protein [Candidatus Saccharimonas sp.]
MNIANLTQGMIGLAVGLVGILGARALLNKKDQHLILQLVGVFLAVAGATLIFASLPVGWVSSSLQLVIATAVFGMASFTMASSSGRKKAGMPVGILLSFFAVVALFAQLGAYLQWVPDGALGNLINAGIQSFKDIVATVGKVIH